MRAAAQTFKTKLAVVSACRRAPAWEVPPELDVTQVMPGHVLHFFCTLDDTYGLYEKCPHITLGMWYSVRRNRFYLTDLTDVLANQCCMTRFSARRSTIHHARAGSGVFASQNSGHKGVAGSYYKPLAYADLGGELRSRKQ